MICQRLLDSLQDLTSSFLLLQYTLDNSSIDYMNLVRTIRTLYSSSKTFRDSTGNDESKISEPFSQNFAACSSCSLPSLLSRLHRCRCFRYCQMLSIIPWFNYSYTLGARIFFAESSQNNLTFYLSDRRISQGHSWINFQVGFAIAHDIRDVPSIYSWNTESTGESEGYSSRLQYVGWANSLHLCDTFN
jgi:hypothetical protein